MEVATSGVHVLPYTASSVGEARRRLTKELVAAAVAESDARDAVLVLSELVSNALRHATPLPDGTIRVAWELAPGSLRLEVADGGGETAPRVHATTGSALGGRGLSIVDRLSLRWGVRRDGAGGETTVWAELPVGEPEYSAPLVIASSRDA